MTADFLPPRQTGRADFLHPALAMRFGQSIHRRRRFGIHQQQRSQSDAREL